MGQILYNGPFNPQYHETYNPPYENFTVQIPSSIASGTALLGVAHVTLVGVSALSIVRQCSQLTICLGWVVPFAGDSESYCHDFLIPFLIS